jgi:hypothetical protein
VLPRQRNDFLILFFAEDRVVIEVDGGRNAGQSPGEPGREDRQIGTRRVL